MANNRRRESSSSGRGEGRGGGRTMQALLENTAFSGNYFCFQRGMQGDGSAHRTSNPTYDTIVHLESPPTQSPPPRSLHASVLPRSSPPSVLPSDGSTLIARDTVTRATTHEDHRDQAHGAPYAEQTGTGFGSNSAGEMQAGATEYFWDTVNDTTNHTLGPSMYMYAGHGGQVHGGQTSGGLPAPQTGAGFMSDSVSGIQAGAAEIFRNDIDDITSFMPYSGVSAHAHHGGQVPGGLHVPQTGADFTSYSFDEMQTGAPEFPSNTPSSGVPMHAGHGGQVHAELDVAQIGFSFTSDSVGGMQVAAPEFPWNDANDIISTVPHSIVHAHYGGQVPGGLYVPQTDADFMSNLFGGVQTGAAELLWNAPSGVLLHGGHDDQIHGSQVQDDLDVAQFDADLTFDSASEMLAAAVNSQWDLAGDFPWGSVPDDIFEDMLVDPYDLA
ncbi:hypothetical protein CERSUDRAFT_118009 [Gelatoporia subvermispora B]|uniref:Uncharacterized protein n=1 Tax=Ceriporiopsis subvermispora (strain B) TaxID=914234 RepID=M2R3D2_CERS8|nr:hypothetical protein CERSUDRAFT_118009 [Gelatoporia subvermispora B]